MTMTSVNQIKNKLQPIFLREPIDKVILFGPYAKGTVTEFSDVALAIDTRGRLAGPDYFRLLDEIVQTLDTATELFEVAEIFDGSPMAQALQEDGIVLFDRIGA
jgi:predicted nucleotidyltransferase